MVRFLVHYGIHFLVPIAIGLLLFKNNRVKVILILLAGIVIDIDDFLDTTIFDAERSSIGFDTVHSYYIALYVLLLIFKKTRLIGLALVIHIIADLADCELIGF